MVKILFFNTDLGGGGAEKVLLNIVNNLDKTKYDITVQTVFKSGVNRKYLTDPRIKQKWFLSRKFKGYSRLALLFSPKLLYKTIVKEKYDIIISFLEGFPSRIISGCEDENTKIVSWIHLELYKNTISYEFRNTKEAQKVYTKFNKIVCVAESVKTCFLDCVSIPENKIEVMYNYLDIDEILKKGQEQVLPPPEKMRLCTVGRLNPQKGYDRLLRIAEKLKNKDNLDFELLILGTGPLESQFKEYISQHKLQDTIKLLGYRDNPYAYIKSSDLFVCSSYKEGYSTVVTESVLLGTPVITTDCSGMAEILDNGNSGIIVKNDENALYEGLKNILSSKKEIDVYTEKTKERALFLKRRNTIEIFNDFIVNLLK